MKQEPEKKQKWYIERFAGRGSNWAIYRNQHDRHPVMGLVRFTGEDGFTEQFDAFAQLVDRGVNNHEALVEALEAIAPRCDQIVDRDTGAKCGLVAVSEGSFGLKYCRAHKGDRELIDVGVQVEAALSAAQE